MDNDSVNYLLGKTQKKYVANANGKWHVNYVKAFTFFIDEKKKYIVLS